MSRMAQHGRGSMGPRPESVLHPPMTRGGPTNPPQNPLGNNGAYPPASQAFHPLGDIPRPSGPLSGPRGSHPPPEGAPQGLRNPAQGSHNPPQGSHHPEEPPRGPIAFTAPAPHPAQAAMQPTLGNPNHPPSRQLPQQQQLPRGLPYASQGPYPAMGGMMHPGTRPFAPQGTPRGMGRGSQGVSWGGMGGYAHPALRSAGVLCLPVGSSACGTFLSRLRWRPTGSLHAQITGCSALTCAAAWVQHLHVQASC